MNTQSDYNTTLASLTETTLEETRAKLLDMVTSDLSEATANAEKAKTLETENTRLKEENYKLFLKITNPTQPKKDPEPHQNKEAYIADLISKGVL